MVIFHSYVSLPEGIHVFFLILPMPSQKHGAEVLEVSSSRKGRQLGMSYRICHFLSDTLNIQKNMEKMVIYSGFSHEKW
jgi:hypothetical protein